MFFHRNYGLIKPNVRKMAYEVAIKNKKVFPTVGMKKNWQEMIGYMVL